jgi:anti-sigma-K factor RskA
MNGAGDERLQELTSLSALGLLKEDEQAELQRELQARPSLADDLRALRQIIVGLAQAVPLIDPPAYLRERVLTAITGRAPAKPSTSTAIGAPTMVVQRPSAWPAWLATAAALIAALGVGFYALNLRGRVDTMASDIASANARASSAEQQLVQLRQALGVAESETQKVRLQAAVLIAPDMARIDLAGQPVAPGAAARAFWSRQKGMVFAASKLPALPAGKVYQLWVVPGGAGAAPISAGLLTPDASGGVTLQIATPPDIPTPVALAVTLEPAGGVPAPTGEKFLVGLTGL